MYDNCPCYVLAPVKLGVCMMLLNVKCGVNGFYPAMIDA